MANKQAPATAISVLSHFVPRKVMLEARELALAIARDEFVKAYVQRRVWFVFPALISFVIVGGACTFGVFVFCHRFVNLAPKFITDVAPILGLVVLVGSVLAQVYLLFSWLERKALRQVRANPEGNAMLLEAVSATEASWQRTPWVLIGVFVMVPLGVLALYSVLVAIMFVGLALAAPIVLTLFLD